MKTSLVNTNKLHTHFITTKTKLLTLLVVFLASMGWGQNASQYAFSQSNGTYIPLVTPTVLGSGSALDNTTYSIAAGSLSGFTFNFAGTNYTAFTVSPNGFIGLGSSLMGGTIYTPLSSSSGGNVFIAAYADDLGGLDANTQISWKLEGTAPNRELVVEYRNMRNYARAGVDLTFQIRLVETANDVKIIYGTMTYTSTTSDNVQVGIKSSTTTGHYSNRTTTTNWTSTSAGTSNTSSCSVLNTVTMPSSGLTFTWTPPTPCSGTPTPGNTLASINPLAIGSSTILSLQNPTSGTGVTYQWKSSTDNVTYSNISGATSATYSASPTISTYYVCDVTCSGVTTTSNSVQVNMATCYTPTALTSSSISYQTVTIGWTAPTNGTSPAGYEYEVRTTGTAGSGATGLVSSGSTTAPTATVSLTGLNGGTSYTYYVRSDCGGGDYSSWSSSGTFTTLSCGLPTALTSSSITYTSATIGWTGPATGSPAGYEYEIRTSGAAGSGATGLVTSGTTTAPTYTASLTGLSAGTTYSIYVRSNCYSGFNSTWTSATTFSTTKIEPTNQITALSAGTVTASAIPLAWTAAATGSQAPDGYLVKASSVDLNSISDPVDGTDPSDVTAFTSNAANKKQTTGTATSTTSFTGMNAGSMYYYKVYSYTNTGAAIDFNTTTPATLVHATKPNAVSSTLTAESITTSSIGFSWSSTAYISGNNEYLIFAKAGSAITSGTPVLNPSTYTANAAFGSGTVYEADANAFCVYKGDGTSLNVTGLNSSTTYYFLIYAVVDGSNSNGSYSYATGTSVNRTTTCGVENAPTTVQTFATFTGSAPSPVCWSEATSSTVAAPSTLTIANSEWLNSSGFANTGSNVGVKTNLYGTDTDDWLISNQIDLGSTPGLYRVKYNMAVTSYNGTSSVSSLGTHIVRLVISTDGGTTWSSANTIKTYTGVGTYSNTGQTEYINLTSYSGVVKIAFVATTSSSTPDIDFHIDNFGIELIPSCFEPTALSIASITNTTASLSWTAPATAPGSGYEVYYSTTNTAPTAGTTPSASVTSGTTYAFNGLTANTTYYSWVRSKCGGSDVSTWAASASFTTLCDPISSFPWNEGFEGLSSVSSTTFPSCWLEGTGTNWNSLSTATSSYNNPRAGNYYIGCTYGGSNDRIWTPGFQLTAGVSYDFSTYFVGDGYAGWTGDVIYNTIQSGTGETVLGSSFIASSTTSSNGTNYSLISRSFTPSTSGVYYFGIRISSSYAPYSYLAFDDFKLELTPACLVPTSLIISSITNATASLTWTAPATIPGSGYDVYYSTTNTAPTSGTTPSASVASGTTYAFSGLSTNTTYYSWVRSNCGGSDLSTWSASASFTTLQVPATVPYSTNFSTNDFTFVNGTQTNIWAYGTAVGNTGSSIYVSNDNGVTNAYTNGSASVVQVYRDIAIPAGATIAQFSFDWKSNGEIDYDYLRVWLVPTTFIPTAGTQITTGSGRIQIGGNFQNVTTWQMYTNNSLDVSSFSNSTMRLVFEWKNDGSDGLDSPVAIDNISFKVPFVWTGTTTTDWATTTNWNLGAIPASTDNIVIPSSGITNFPVATSLTIAAGSTMSLNANARLTVNGTLTNNGTLTLESGATLVQGTGNTVAGSGTFNVKQALTGAGGATPSGRFWYLGSPVSTANSGVFNAAGNNRLWTYSETALAYNTEITDNTTALSPMQGAVVRLGASETSIFTGGLLNTGDYTSSLTRTGTTDSKRGYTLLSNPYPSYLDWSAAYNAAVASNANISSSIWYRSHNSTSNTMVFDIYNASSSVATTNSSGTTTQYIPPMQAFWVYNPTDGTTGSLTFSNSMRSHQSNGGLKSSTDFPAFVRLNLENDGAIDQTVLYFDNNAAAGYDNFDSDKMMLANAAQVYSFVDNKKLAINGMKSVKANKQVPLTVEFPTAKSYAFNATEVAMIDGIVLLEDRLTKVFQDLTMNPVYEFEAAAGTAADRFVVHFQANSGVAGIESAEDNGIAIVSNATGLVTITLSEELPAMGTIQIIDANGKVIATQAINEQATTMNINAATGIYHVLVDTSSKIARKKIVITK